MKNVKRYEISPIKKLDLNDLIIDSLGKMLTNGVLKPGEKVPSERELAEMLNVSRPSLRQALKGLSLLGVFESRPGVGTFVNESLSNLLINPLKIMMMVHEIKLIELFETRRIFEPSLTELAAERISEAEIEAAKEVLSESAKYLDEPEKFLSSGSDLRFHNIIYESTGNSLMLVFIQSINHLLENSRQKTVYLFNDLKETLEQHYKILYSLEKRDPKAAKEAMVKHIWAVEQRIIHDGKKMLYNE